MCRRVERKVHVLCPDYLHTLFIQGHTLGESTIQCKGMGHGAHTTMPVCETGIVVCIITCTLYVDKLNTNLYSQSIPGY